MQTQLLDDITHHPATFFYDVTRCSSDLVTRRTILPRGLLPQMQFGGPGKRHRPAAKGKLQSRIRGCIGNSEVE